MTLVRIKFLEGFPSGYGILSDAAQRLGPKQPRLLLKPIPNEGFIPLRIPGLLIKNLVITGGSNTP